MMGNRAITLRSWARSCAHRYLSPLFCIYTDDIYWLALLAYENYYLGKAHLYNICVAICIARGRFNRGTAGSYYVSRILSPLLIQIFWKQIHRLFGRWPWICRSSEAPLVLGWITYRQLRHYVGNNKRLFLVSLVPEVPIRESSYFVRQRLICYIHSPARKTRKANSRVCV